VFAPTGGIGPGKWGDEPDFFSILIFFNYYFRNKSGETFFPNLLLLSRVNLSDVIYEEVHLA
jgi:hypothetical protein